MFQTRSHSWREAGLARQLSSRAVRRARVQILVFLPLLIGVLVVEHERERLLGADVPTRLVAALVLLVLAWQVARDVGRAAGPTLFRRMDPATAGTTGFLIRLVTMLIAVAIALHIAGITQRTLALGGAFTAVIFGLAAQQTFGNLIAGMVLLSARPFRVGERVRLQGGALAGTLEGVVSSLGLLYTTFANGDDAVMVPNSAVLSVAVLPVREPDAVDVRARVPFAVGPADLQRRLQEAIDVPTRGAPRIELEEIEGDEVTVRIRVSPEHPVHGSRLATEVLTAIAPITRPGRPGDGGGATRATPPPPVRERRPVAANGAAGSGAPPEGPGAPR